MSTESMTKCDLCGLEIVEGEHAGIDGIVFAISNKLCAKGIQNQRFVLTPVDDNGDVDEDVDVCIECVRNFASAIKKTK